MKSIIYLLCACWIACLLSTGCKHSTDYEKSPSVQLTTLIQDSIIRYKPQEAEMLLAKAKQQAQDSTEYYYAEAVHSSLLMTRQQEDSAFYYINRCEKFCLSLPKLLPIHYLTLGIAENNKASLLENSNHPLSAKTAYEKAIQYYQRGNMHKRLPNVYNNLGYVYYTSHASLLLQKSSLHMRFAILASDLQEQQLLYAGILLCTTEKLSTSPLLP